MKRITAVGMAVAGTAAAVVLLPWGELGRFDLSLGLLLGGAVGGVAGLCGGLWAGVRNYHDPALERELHQAREALAAIRLHSSRTVQQLHGLPPRRNLALVRH